ncbi:LysR substrate-binding domain-containing protein [Herbiconiux sp. P16]|uniref:LysR substrate-binding domain-containing protein n=1 Tax=Herbiconiux wuyangfengii TaxID=3342794 RepID=UPI0035B7A308
MPPTLSSVDLNLLIPLQALLRERNVTRAAARVGMSQPAMSNALKRLRITLADPLLVRAGGGYELTIRAKQLAKPLEDALQMVGEKVFKIEAFDPASSRREFRLAASSSTVFVALKDLVADATTRYPQITFSVVAGGRSADEMFRDLNLDLVLLPEVLPTVNPRERLYDEDWVFICADDNPHIGDRLQIDQVFTLPHAVYQQDGLRTHGELALETHGRSIVQAVKCDDFMSVFHLIPRTGLIALVQTNVARHLARQNGLRVLASPIPLPPFGIDMVWNPLSPMDPGYVWLREQLVAFAPSSDKG